jgi:BMFP domain-containing protein YqiC
MQTDNRLFDDLAKLATNAIGTATAVRQEVEARFKAQLERLVVDMNLVTRDDYEAVKEMAAKARAEQEVLAERVAKLEAELAVLKGTSEAPQII